MRVIFINLHCNSFVVNTLFDILQRQKKPTKHRALLDSLLNDNIEVLNLITFSGTSVAHRYALFHKMLNRLSLYVKEAEYVFKKNGINNVENIIDPQKINISENDVIVYYGFYLDSNQDYYFNKGHKVIDMTHFYGSKKRSDIAKLIGPECIVSEVNLKKYSRMFKKNYEWYKGDIFVRPFSYEDRFVNNTKFDKRVNKCFISGSLANLYIDLDLHYEYCMEYCTKYMQPQRERIYNIRDKMNDYIDCASYDFNEAMKRQRVNITEKQLYIEREINYWRNYFIGGRLPRYFTAFDMVKKYNYYKMFACGEDANGIYGIGAIEGMACGCAYIGMKYGAYEDLGLKSEYNYISYDGSMDDFSDKVKFYLDYKNQNKLEQIARRGCECIRKICSNFKVGKENNKMIFDLVKQRV